MVEKDSAQCSYFKQEKDSHARQDRDAECQLGDFTSVRPISDSIYRMEILPKAAEFW